MWSIREDAKTFGIDNNLQWRFSGDRVEHTVLAGPDYRRLESDYGYGFDFSATGLDAFDPVYGTIDRQSVVEGRRWAVRVDTGGRSILKKQQTKLIHKKKYQDK